MSAKFVIVGAARTGSTLLVRTLNSLEGVRCHGELLGDRVRGYEDDFDPTAASPAEREARMAALKRERDADPVAFIGAALAGNQRASGFKALYAAFLDPRWRAVIDSLLADEDVRFIHLRRRNGLRRFVSETVLRAGGPNHSAAGGRSEQRVRVHIDVGEFKRVEAQIARQAAQIDELLSGQSVFELSYEALADDTPAAVSRVCDFLGLAVSPPDIRPALHKVGAADIRDTVSNYRELLDDPAIRPFLSGE
ncbi:MAG: sulfotransferase [Halioglobus sp.]|nr:sulfotransferase [Halioglobus sp.]